MRKEKKLWKHNMKKPLTDKEKLFWDKYIQYHIDHLKTPTRDEMAPKLV